MAAKRCEHCGAIMPDTTNICPLCGGQSLQIQNMVHEVCPQSQLPIEELPVPEESELAEQNDDNVNKQNLDTYEDKPSIILCLIPIILTCTAPIFLIIATFQRKKSPRKAKALLICSIIGIIISIIVFLIFGAITLAGLRDIIKAVK